MLESKKENILSQIAYPEMYDPLAVSYEVVSKILYHKESVGKGKNIATSIDLHRTPKNFTDQDILDSVSNHIGIFMGKQEDRMEDKTKREEYDQVLANMNEALKEAKTYIEEVLNLKAPSAIIDSTKGIVDSKKQIIDLIRKTQRYGEPDHKGLEVHAGYCALISTALAVFELQKQESHTLKSEMRSLEDFLTTESDSNDQMPLFRKHYAIDTSGPAMVTLSDSSPISVRLSMRDKSTHSQITKYLMKPESSAAEALKDAIGIRMEIANDRIEDALIRILQYIPENLGATDIRLENKLFNPAQLADLMSRTSQEVPENDAISFISDKNPLSADSFRVIKILCDIVIPGGKNKRSIEIQIVEPENKNERKLSSHDIYDLKKKVTVMTRLFGGCSEAWLKNQLKRISNMEGYAEKIITGLQEIGFLMQLPGTKKAYGAISVYDRWSKVPGLIEDSKIHQQIEHGLANTPRH